MPYGRFGLKMVECDKIYNGARDRRPSGGIPTVKACILVNCKLLRMRKVLDVAKREPGVKSAFPVHGRWDIAVETEDLGLKDIADIGMHIYKTDGVEIVETLIEFPEAK
jgi:hypothetical protein